MKDFYLSPDFHRNQLLNVTLQRLASSPSTPNEALIYYDDNTKTIWFYNGSSWQDLKSGVITAAGTTFSNAGTTLTATTVQAAIEEIRTNNPKNNLASSNPAAANDNTQGYRALSIWINTTSGEAFICTDATTGAAVWKSLTKLAATEVSFNNSGTFLVATTVQAAIAELDGRLNTVEGQAHDQNTDTGTDQTSFQLDSGNSGPRLKNESGVVALRNAADNDYASLRIKDLILEGEMQQTTGNVVNTGDQEVLLNSDITTNAQNADGSIRVKRLLPDNTTRADAQVRYVESDKKWKLIFGDGVVQRDIVSKYMQDIGDGSATQFDITHSLNTLDCIVRVRENSAPFADVECEIERLTSDQVRVRFAGYTPANNEFRVIIAG